MEELNGRKLGPYQIVSLLGRGGMATVYKAYHLAMERYVALKVLPVKNQADPNYLVRFRQEARVIASLEHPNILPVYDYGEQDGYTYLAMRYLDGGSLADMLGKGPLPFEKVGEILAHLSEALDYAHSRGVIHRDIKPSNVLIDQHGRFLLADFGIAKIAASTEQFTMTGGFIGTPQYASPEQGLGQPLDGRSDLYSLGVVLHEMVTGKQPFEADTPMGVVVKHVHEPLPPPRSLNPALPAALERVITKSLAKDPEQRFQSAGQLARAYQQALASETSQSTVIEANETIIEPPPVLPPTSQLAPISSVVGADLPDLVAQKKQGNRSKILVFSGLGVLLLCLIAAGGFGLAARLIQSPEKPPAAVAIPTESPQVQVVNEVSPSPTSTAPRPSPVPPVGSDNIYVEYIIDASGSMLEPLEGKTRLEIARKVLAERVAALPPDVHVGLRAYGHRVPYQQEEESCRDIELVVLVEVGGAERILEWLPEMQALGMTPIAESIRQAAEDFTFEPGRKNSIILLSDGIETCGEDPSDVVRFLQELGINFTIHVIGLAVDEAARAQLSRLAETAGGVYHDVNGEQDLREALENAANISIEPEVVEPAATLVASPTPIPEPNTNAASEGVVTASTTYEGFPASLSVDGSTATSWFSLGPGADGPTSEYTWTGAQEEFISRLVVLSNRENAEPSFRTGYGFESLTVRIFDTGGSVVYEETVELPGTPDQDVTLQPAVVGKIVELLFGGHEAFDCGGFSELQVWVTR